MILFGATIDLYARLKKGQESRPFMVYFDLQVEIRDDVLLLAFIDTDALLR
jgi:hypothetical protein